MKALAFVALVVAACGSSSDGSSTTTVKDALGRTCQVGGGLSISCDRAPKPTIACANGTACFTVGVTTSGTSAGCDSCCTGNSAASNGTDCSPIRCTTNADCPHVQDGSSCVDGACKR